MIIHRFPEKVNNGMAARKYRSSGLCGRVPGKGKNAGERQTGVYVRKQAYIIIGRKKDKNTIGDLVK